MSCPHFSRAWPVNTGYFLPCTQGHSQGCESGGWGGAAEAPPHADFALPPPSPLPGKPWRAKSKAASPCQRPARPPSARATSALGLLTLALLLPLLELTQPPRPRVPPLDHQAALVCHDATLVGRVLSIAQQQVLLEGLDFGALAGYVS